MRERALLLTGATGFVGGAVRPALAAKGWRVRCLTRDATQARRREPTLDWVQGDVRDPASCAGALEGCRAALYLVHGIGEGADYHRRELAAASTFSRAAAAAGVERIVYPVLARRLPFLATDTALLYSALRAHPPVIAAIALAPVVLGEELVWRSAVQTALVRHLGPRTGVTLAALAYGLAHAPLASPLLVVVALLCGIAWGTLRAASASLVPTLVAHLVWDALVLLWLPLDS